MFELWKSWLQKKKEQGLSESSVEKPTVTDLSDTVGHVDFKNLQPITKRFKIKGLEEKRKKRQANPFYDEHGNLHQK